MGKTSFQDHFKQALIWPYEVRVTALIAAIVVVLMLTLDHEGHLTGGDFVNYWMGGRLALDGHVAVLFDRDAYHAAETTLAHYAWSPFSVWSYPPSFIPYVLWLGALPYKVAYAAWIAVTFAFYGFAVAFKRPMPWATLTLLILAPSSIANADIGQNGFLSAALLVGGLRLLNLRPSSSGVLFGLLSFKPQIGLLVPVALFAARKWRVLAIACLTTICLIGLSILLFGFEPWELYFKVTVPFQRMALESAPNLPFTKMMPSSFMAARQLGASLGLSYGIASMTAFGSLCAVFYAFRSDAPPDLRNAVLLTATFLTSPYIQFWDMTALSAAVISTIAASGPRVKPFSLVLFFDVWFMPIGVFFINCMGVPICPLLTAALLGVQLHMIKTREKAETP